MYDLISKSDFEKAYNYLENILKEDVESIELSDRIPAINELSDANTVFKGKLSVLFVDMRKSTDLTDELEAINMAKIYRAFIRSVVQAIRYSGGESRQFAGDGVMAVFKDNDETSITSEQQAIKAARYIITVIDYCLNPLLSKHMDGLVIGCGVGISTGTVLMTKVGMRGKEADENSENEMSIVWTGSTTNYANRFCSLAKPCEIFVDETTYANAQDNGEWKKDTRIKGDKSFTGYTIKGYYLSLPNDIADEKVTCCEDESEPNFTQELFCDMKIKAVELVDEISEKSVELTKKIDEVNKKEQDLVSEKNRLLKEFEEKTREKELSLVRRRYIDILRIFQNTFCKDELIKQIGEDYWLALINEVYDTGDILGKNKDEVTSDLDCELIRIYLYCFPDYEKAYDALCIKAKFSTWLNESIIREVVKKSGHWLQLKQILEEKSSNFDDHIKALQILKGMGY